MWPMDLLFFQSFVFVNLFSERMFCICDRVWEGVLVSTCNTSTCFDVSSVVLENVLLCVWRG